MSTDKRKPRVSDLVKMKLEDETLVHFRNALVRRGMPALDLVEYRERPDRTVRFVGSPDLVGVEVTRMVQADDAESLTRECYLSRTLSDVLSKHSRGGLGMIFGGRFPDASPAALQRLTLSLDRAVRDVGGIGNLAMWGRGGYWKHEGTVYHFEVSDDEGWRFLNNGVRAPRRETVPAHELDEMLLARLEDKCPDVASFEWDGRLVLLVRNPYQPHVPAHATLVKAADLCEPVVDEAWLVNHRESALDLSPPEPVLVRLWPHS